MRIVILTLVITATVLPGGVRQSAFVATGGRSGRVVGYIGTYAPALPSNPERVYLYLPLVMQ
jgi:hypothetical protein